MRSPPLRSASALVVVLAAACAPSVTASSGGGGASSTAAGGFAGATSSTGGGTGGTTSAGGGGAGGTGGGPSGPHLSAPRVIDLPYVIAGAGGSTAEAMLTNDGDAPVNGLSASLGGSALLSMSGDVAATVAPGDSILVTLTFAGSAAETIESASLDVVYEGASLEVPVFGVAGDPALGDGDFADLTGPGGVVIGQGLTLSMPTAPFPHPGAPYTDDHVHVFVPEGYRDLGAQDIVTHFHGHSTTIDATLAGHHYREHLYASGADAVLVVPQGPVNAASGDFGKLMDPGGLAAMLQEVLVVLYREGKIAFPVLGDLTLTSHSGGYAAVATNLEPAAMAPPVEQVDLFDSLYGFEPTYESFVTVTGGVLRSNYTLGGGTLDNNQAFVQTLNADGFPVIETSTQNALRSIAPVIFFADTSHEGSTRIQGAYGEQIRFHARHHRHGPRLELRSVVAANGLVQVGWWSPPDDEAKGFAIETSDDEGATWSVAVELPPGELQWSVSASSAVRVRVRTVSPGVDTLPTNEYRAAPQASILVVDGFDRVIDGAFGGLRHDLAAVAGEALGDVATVSHEAVGEDGFDLSSWPVVVWLSGDQSTGDVALTPAERAALLAYVDGGGRLIMAGSEIAYALAPDPDGADFLTHCFGAAYAADSSGSYSASGTGPLAGVASFTYAGPGAAYVPGYPDVLAAAAGGEVLLRYATNQPAAVGKPGQAAFVGFPPELTDSAAARKALFAALVAYVEGQ